MAEFWQAYGNWILIGVFFFFMIGHHLFMGHGSHGAHNDEGAASDGAGERGARSDNKPRRRAGGCH